jgi:hypothetical protein
VILTSRESGKRDAQKIEIITSLFFKRCPKKNTQILILSPNLNLKLEPKPNTERKKKKKCEHKHKYKHKHE